ncbi:D-alanyl-D-alanine carboxypeptidase family protein [Haloimpatiens sp. FM7315]|uniref:D-alanyl-D-alanine carboxypeptidase family protein n=1 Tax=Haloimpatiens sp. FM7315 TaxID=3298609 RepID=UPI00370AE483
MKKKICKNLILFILPIMIFNNNVAKAYNLNYINPNKNLEKKININARNAIAIDMNTKEVLFEKNAYDVTAIASTTKIMTALVALNYGNIKNKINISNNSASIRGSTVGYKKGEQIAMEELLYGLMLRSGNDAAIAIAEGIAGSIDKFCEIMNEYAYSIGATNSHFESPHGLDSNYHYSTAYDLALITCKAKEIKEFNEIVSCKSISSKDKDFTRSYNNINKILWRIPEANGVKTGYTGNAGKCLVTSLRIDDREIVIVVINSPTRWEETQKIYSFIKENYNYTKIANKNEILKTTIIDNKQTLNLVADKDIIIPIKKDVKFKKHIIINKDLNDKSIKKGDSIGRLILLDEDGKILYKTILVSDRNYTYRTKSIPKRLLKYFKNK